LEKTKQLITDPNRHCAFRQPRKADHGSGAIAWALGEFPLDFKARGANAVGTRHQRAKRIFIRYAVQSDRPVLSRPQRYRHPGRIGKSARVITIDRGAGEFFDQLLVAKLHQPPSYPRRGAMSKLHTMRHGDSARRSGHRLPWLTRRPIQSGRQYLVRFLLFLQKGELVR
jgi:hypothetical protein